MYASALPGSSQIAITTSVFSSSGSDHMLLAPTPAWCNGKRVGRLLGQEQHSMGENTRDKIEQVLLSWGPRQVN